MDLLNILNYGKKKKPESSKYAGFNRRMLAVTIDSVILMVFMPLINHLAPLNTTGLDNYAIDPQDPQAGSHLLMHILGNEPFLESWLTNFFMQMLFWCVFSAIFLHFWSATPGKMFMRMKVVDAKTEARINDLQVFLRSFGYLVSVAPLGLGFLWIGLNKRRRGWHDYLADTVVINLPLMPWRKAPPAEVSPVSTTVEPEVHEPQTEEPKPPGTDSI